MADESLYVSCEKCCFGKMCKDYLFDNCVALFTQSLQRKKIIKKGEYIYRPGDQIVHLIALRMGTVKIYDANNDLVNVKTPGQIIGTEDLHINRYHHQAVAATDVQLCLLERSRVYDLSLITENFIHYVIDILSHEIAEQQKMISVLASPNAQMRVREYLKLVIQRYEWYGFPTAKIPFPLSLKEMATLLGVSVSSLNRTIFELKESGEIIVDKKNIQVTASVISSLKIAPV